MSNKSKSTTFLLCYFLGLFGVHRFYLNKVLTGILMLITLGGLGIWWLVDSVLIVAGQMKDREGNALRTGPPDPDDPSAGFWVRLAAISVDGIILNLIVSVLFTGLALVLPLVGMGAMGAMGMGGSLQGMGSDDQAMMGAAMGGGMLLLGLLSIPVYFGLQHASRHQATVGKRCFEIYVTAGDGARVGLGRAVWRSLAYLISALPLYLGFIMAGFTRDKRALHDYLAGTRVLHVAEAGMVSRDADTEQPAPAPMPSPAPVRATVEKAPAGGGAGTGLIILGALLLAGAAAVALLL